MRTPITTFAQREYAPFIMFGLAALPLAACYIVFWAGLGASVVPQSILPILLAAAWSATALMVVGAAISKPIRWLYAGLGGVALLASSAAAPFSFALAPVGVGLIAASAVGLTAKRRSISRKDRRQIRMASRPTIIALGMIALGIALPAWASAAAPSVLALWTALGLSFVGAGMTLAFWDWARASCQNQDSRD